LIAKKQDAEKQHASLLDINSSHRLAISSANKDKREEGYIENEVFGRFVAIFALQQSETASSGTWLSVPLEVSFLVQSQLVVLGESVPGCHTGLIKLSITLVRLGFEGAVRISVGHQELEREYRKSRTADQP
jgi:hypothetical protein